MKTAARILYGLAGSTLKGFRMLPTLHSCRICGSAIDRGADFAAWLKPTATDWATWQGPAEGGRKGDGYVCEPCAWVRSGKPAKPPAPGSDEYPVPGAFRLLAHVWDEVSGWRWWTMGNKAGIRDAILACLALPPGTRWFAAVPDSSKKHTLIYADVNRAGMRAPVVAFETERVRLGVEGDRWPCLDVAQGAYQAGWSKAEILAGQASSWRMSKLGVAACSEMARRLRRYVHSSELELATWLAQREEETDAKTDGDREGQPAQHLERLAGSPGEGLPGQADEHVGANPQHDGQRGQADEQPGPLVDAAPAQPPDRGPGGSDPGQLSLFDLAARP